METALFVALVCGFVALVLGYLLGKRDRNRLPPG